MKIKLRKRHFAGDTGLRRANSFHRSFQAFSSRRSHPVTGRRSNAANDHIADFPFGVATHNVDDLRRVHSDSDRRAWTWFGCWIVVGAIILFGGYETMRRPSSRDSRPLEHFTFLRSRLRAYRWHPAAAFRDVAAGFHQYKKGKPL